MINLQIYTFFSAIYTTTYIFKQIKHFITIQRVCIVQQRVYNVCEKYIKLYFMNCHVIFHVIPLLLNYLYSYYSTYTYLL